jgi:hypothetical protein
MNETRLNCVDSVRLSLRDGEWMVLLMGPHSYREIQDTGSAEVRTGLGSQCSPGAAATLMAQVYPGVKIEIDGERWTRQTNVVLENGDFEEEKPESVARKALTRWLSLAVVFWVTGAMIYFVLRS